MSKKKVLTDKDLSAYKFGEKVEVVKVTINDLDKFNGDNEVCVIAGSRAMAIKCADMN